MAKNMSTSGKLFLLGLLSLLAVIAVGLLGSWSLNRLSEQDQMALHGAERDSGIMLTIKGAQGSFLIQVQEWKNILIRGNETEMFAKHQSGFNAQAIKTQNLLRTAGELMRERQMPTAVLEQLIVEHGELTRRYREALADFRHDDPHAGKQVDKRVRGMDRATVAAMEQLVNAMEVEFARRIAGANEESRRIGREIAAVFAATALVAALAIALLAVLIRKDLMRLLGGEPAYAATVVRRIAEGDLATPIQLRSGDEQSLLAAMQGMRLALVKVIGQIQESSRRLAGAAENLAASSGQVAASSTGQSNASTAMAASMEEMSSSIGQVADSAQRSRELADQARHSSASSGQLVQKTIEEIHRIAQSVDGSARVVHGLGEHSQQISGIANTIKEIADQTNLLALNAAIEAARAGEQGRGFAVVADEVRKLAEKTTVSTQEIGAMIGAIQRGTAEAVAQMQNGTAQVRSGVETATRTGASMAGIEDGAGRVLLAVDDISSALREQSIASGEISRRIEDIVQMAEENGSAVRQISSAADHLQGLADELRLAVGHFRLAAT